MGLKGVGLASSPTDWAHCEYNHDFLCGIYLSSCSQGVICLILMLDGKNFMILRIVLKGGYTMVHNGELE